MKRENPIYVVIHNIDGLKLRSHDCQSTLAALVTYSQVNNDLSFVHEDLFNERILRLVASIDHVDASLHLWDVDLLEQFSWVGNFHSTNCF